MESFCLLCYKSIGLSPENISKLANRNILSLHRFVKTLVGRNVANVLFANENNQIGICQSCVWVLEKFSDLSLELECIQMKMQWELKTLKQVLHQAALVPSRLNRLQEYFSTDEDSKMALEKHLGIRKKIYLKCKQNIKIHAPVVKLALGDERFLKFENVTPIDNADEESLADDSMPDSMESDSTCTQESVFAVNEFEVKITDDNLDEASENKNILDDLQKLTDKHTPRQLEFNTDASQIKIETCQLASCNKNDGKSTAEIDLSNSNICDSKINLENAEPVSKSTNSMRLRKTFKCKICVRTFSSEVTLNQHENSGLCTDTNQEEPEVDEEKEVNPESVNTKTRDNDEYNSEDSSSSDSSHSSVSSQNSNKEAKKYSAKKTVTKRRISSKNICPEKGCGKAFGTKEWLHLHKLLHGDFTCKFCSFQTNLADELLDHEWTNHAMKGLQNSKKRCSRCPRLFGTNNVQDTVLKKHFFIEHLNIDYAHGKCHICGKRFSSNTMRLKGLLRRHLKLHDVTGLIPENIFKCETCHAPFKNAVSLKIHMVDVHKSMSHLKCQVCSRSFSRLRHLTSHLKIVHKMADQKDTIHFKCSFPGCEELFFNKVSLKVHSNRHKGEMLICQVCGKQAMDKTTLGFHMKIHDKPKPRGNKLFSAVCHLCGKVSYGYQQSNALEKQKQHMDSKFHSKDREGGLAASWKFSCEICGKLCHNPFKLEEHIRTHTNEKPFVCTDCGREFSILSNLKRHMKLVHKKVMVGRKNPEMDS